MYTIIDIINFRGWIHRYPDLVARGEGILLVLDPSQISDKPNIPYNKVKILRPDKTTIELSVDEIEVRHKVVGMFIKGVYRDEVPRLSIISW